MDRRLKGKEAPTDTPSSEVGWFVHSTFDASHPSIQAVQNRADYYSAIR